MQVTYQILGPGTLQDTADNIEDALKKGSRMIALPLFGVDALRKRLREGKNAIWGYGFDEVWVMPVATQEGEAK